jgi:hypothetical protein
MRFPRMTTRRWMAAIALAAVATSACLTCSHYLRRSRSFARLAAREAERERQSLRWAQFNTKQAREWSLFRSYPVWLEASRKASWVEWRFEVERNRHLASAAASREDAADARRAQEHYRRAARYPWLYAEPGPRGR